MNCLIIFFTAIVSNQAGSVYDLELILAQPMETLAITKQVFALSALNKTSLMPKGS